VIGIFAAAAVFALSACAVPPDAAADGGATEGSVLIGVFEPLSGSERAGGAAEIAGIELAHSLRPEVLGRPVELVRSDNRSDLDGARNAARLLAWRGVSVVIGSYGNTLSLAGGEVFEELGLPAIAVTNGNPLVTNTNDCYFRVRPLDTFQGVAAAKYAVEKLATTRAAVMRDTDSDYSVAMCQAFSDKYISLTGNPDAVAYTFDYGAGTDDYSSGLRDIRDAGAEAVFLPAEAGDALAAAGQAREIGLEAVFVGTELWEADDTLLKATDSALLSRLAFSSAQGRDSGRTARRDEFLRAFSARFGGVTEPGPSVALGFDAYMLAIDAIERAGSAERGAVRQALAETRSFPGASGEISFDENGDPIKPVPIMAARDGAFVNIYTAEPKWAVATEAAILP
jgi:branched-chain amino acid transport system substrate-binding protein